MKTKIESSYLVSLLCLTLAATAWAQTDAEPYRLTETIRNPSTNGMRSSGFGSCVAMDGALAVVGAPKAQSEIPDISAYASQYSGRGLVQVYDAATQELLFRLKPPPGFTTSEFGHKVAISGALVAVSTSNEMVFVYDLKGNVPLLPRWAITNPVNKLFSDFGKAIALDGHRLLVGDKDYTGGWGCVYYYDLSSAKPTTPKVVFKNPKPSNFSDWFGDALDVSGHRVVIGAYYYDLRRALPHLPVKRLKTEEPFFTGWIDPHASACVALDGPKAAVGYRGRVFFYDLDATDPSLSTRYIDVAHQSLAWADGDNLVVARRGSYRSYLVAGVINSSNSSRYLEVPSGENPANAVGITAVSASGKWILVGGESSGTKPEGAIVERQTGYAGLFDAASTALPAVGRLADTSRFKDEQFGGALALFGSLLAVGARSEDIETPSFYENTGSVYVYDLAGSDPRTPLAVLKRGRFEGHYMFGTRVAIFGRKVVAASLASNGNVGGVFLYDLDVPGSSTKLPVTGAIVDNFIRFDMAASGQWLVVAGASGGVRGVFAFDLASANPAQVVHRFVLPPDGAAAFNTNAVAVSGTWVVATGSRATHIFDLSSATPTTAVRTLARGGSVVAIAGSHLAVGSGGTVRVFDLQASDSEEPPKTWTGGAAFGAAIAGSGDHVLISDHSTFAAPVARLYSATAPPGADLVQTFGSLSSERGVLQSSVRVVMDGDSLAIGDLSRSAIPAHDGSVYVHRLDEVATVAPTLHSPVSGAHVGRSLRLSFTLPEAALPGSVKVNLGNSTWTLGTHHETAGTHSLLIDPLAPASSLGVAAGSYPGEGFHAISLEYRDSAGNEPATVSGGKITIDTVPPLMIGLQNVQLQSPSGKPVLLRYETPVTSDASPLVTLTLSHPTGSPMYPGITDGTATAVDLAGNATVGRFAVSVMGLSITSPAKDQRVASSESGTLVQGTVVGSASVVTLLYPPNRSLPINVGSGTPGLRRWSVRLLDLPPALNSLQATASDGVQTIASSPTRFFQQVLRPVTTSILPAGAGSLTFSPALLPGGMAVVGQNYEVTATAKRGFHFSEWAAGATGYGPVGVFTASAGGNDISASFIPTPFTPERVGTFITVLSDGSQEYSGYIALRLAPYTGAFTARFVIDGVSKSIKGRFDPVDRYYNSLREHRKDVEVSLGISDSTAGPTLSGEVTLNGEDFYAEIPLLGEAHLAHDEKVPVPEEWRGSFNVGVGVPSEINDNGPSDGHAIEGGTGDAPTGSGYLTVNVGKSGLATCNGRLADGTAFTSSQRVDRMGRLPLAASFAKRAGLLLGDLTFVSSFDRDLTGSLRWFKKPSASAYYPAGFTGGLQLDAIGAHTATSTPDTLNLSAEISLGVAIQNTREDAILNNVKPLLWSRSAAPKAHILFTSTGRISGHFTHTQFGSCSLSGLIVSKGDVAWLYGFALSAPRGTPGSAFGGEISILP